MYLRYKAHWGTLLWDLTKINVRREPLPRLLSLPLVLPQKISKIKLNKIHVTQVRYDFLVESTVMYTKPRLTISYTAQ